MEGGAGRAPVRVEAAMKVGPPAQGWRAARGRCSPLETGAPLGAHACVARHAAVARHGVGLAQLGLAMTVVLAVGVPMIMPMAHAGVARHAGVVRHAWCMAQLGLAMAMVMAVTVGLAVAVTLVMPMPLTTTVGMAFVLGLWDGLGRLGAPELGQPQAKAERGDAREGGALLDARLRLHEPAGRVAALSSLTPDPSLCCHRRPLLPCCFGYCLRMALCCVHQPLLLPLLLPLGPVLGLELREVQGPHLRP